MIIEVKVPSPGESIPEVQLAAWLVEEGDVVEKDQDIAEIDSDKATLAIAAEESGKIKFMAQEGDTLEIGAVIATIDTSVKPDQKSAKKATKKENTPDTQQAQQESPKADTTEKPVEKKQHVDASDKAYLNVSPLARKLMQEKNMNDHELEAFIKSYRFKREDIEMISDEKPSGQKQAALSPSLWGGGRQEERKKMSSLRKKLAARLVSVKNETAMLTTFNEVDMQAIMDLRKNHKEDFKEKHGVGLGFMSFFTKAVTEALAHFPEVNASIDADEIVYHNYADIGIAVSSPKGLVVPVLRNAEQMSLATIESEIKALAAKARKNRLSLEEMMGGTFTITNGGVFGSMLSTPIINPPQSAILGMHNIVERPVVKNGKIVVAPVMYVALSYDHRIIDGKESVSFLYKVKEMLEDPVRMLFGSRSASEALLDL